MVSRRHKEDKVTGLIREKTEYHVENISSAASKEWIGGIRHTGIDDYILRHIDLHSSTPQKIIYRGVPDLACVRKYSVPEAMKLKKVDVEELCYRNKSNGLEIDLLLKGDFDMVKELKFVEVKAKGDCLNDNQIKWIENFTDTFDTEIAEIGECYVRFYDATDYVKQSKPEATRIWSIEE